MDSNLEFPFQNLTQGIQVEIRPELNKIETQPHKSLYVYNYTIRITNTGKDTVQLISRNWIITDGFNKKEHVQGMGVIGKQPVLRPGESFTYTSFCPLHTPTGKMEGSFQMRGSQQNEFSAAIAPFKLADVNLVN